jgi:probable F420-dependent oxidoreductase
MVRTMRVGVHLPQFGRAAVAGAMQRVAARAEELGFDDVWVSDHLVVPADQRYPPPFLCDPLVSLAFAAAATTRIGIGTSVLVAPQYPSPLAVANSLATLDHLSGGRLTLGLGIGWSAAEYRALGAPFSDRGERLEEIIALFRTVWTDDPATHEGRFYPFSDIRLLPKPAHPVPIWLGGTSDAAMERATRLADGYHGIGLEPVAAAALVTRLRDRRPEHTFTISLRIRWDAKAEQAEVKEALAGYEEAGIQHLLYAPERGDLDTWLASVEQLASQVGLS